jgi:Secretion system C-terminal sorting domain
MKYTILILYFSLLLHPILQGQSWFDNSPQWTNRIVTYLKGPATEYCTITGDTMVGGVNAKICTRLRDYDNYPPFKGYRILYQTGDSILYWENNKYLLLYDFSLVPGNSLIVKRSDGSIVLSYLIESTGVINLNNQILRTQKIMASAGGNWDITGTIIEKIGAVYMQRIQPGSLDTVDLGTHFFLQESNNLILDGIDWRFCNFKNNQFSYMESGGNCIDIPQPVDTCVANVLVKMINSGPCVLPQVVSSGEILVPCAAPSAFYQLPVGTEVLVYIKSHPGCAEFCLQDSVVEIVCFKSDVSGTSSPAGKPENSILLYPNPASASVFYTNFDSGMIRITDTKGNVVLDLKTNPTHQIDIEQLIPGIYFTSFINKERIVVKKLIVLN